MWLEAAKERSPPLRLRVRARWPRPRRSGPVDALAMGELSRAGASSRLLLAAALRALAGGGGGESCILYMQCQ